MTKKERVLKLRELLDKAYPDVKCSLNYTTPLEMLIATQMSAQCTDARVNIITETLFKKYRNAEDFANADYDELCEDIKSAGFYRNKAKNIILCCQRLIDVYGGEVPDTMEDLTSLAGTGRKTANLVLGDIFGKPAVVVDTHCKRIAKRIVSTTNRYISFTLQQEVVRKHYSTQSPHTAPVAARNAPVWARSQRVGAVLIQPNIAQNPRFPGIFYFTTKAFTLAGIFLYR